MYALEIIGVALLLVAVSIALEATSEDGWTWTWLGVLIGMTGITGLVFFPLLRAWLRKGAAPSDWRRFAALSSILLFVGSVAVLLFLVAVLGRGGTAEGVVIGVLLAWGLVTLEDGRRIQRTQDGEKRVYWAAGRRPWGAGNRLVFTISRG